MTRISPPKPTGIAGHRTIRVTRAWLAEILARSHNSMTPEEALDTYLYVSHDWVGGTAPVEDGWIGFEDAADHSRWLDEHIPGHADVPLPDPWTIRARPDLDAPYEFKFSEDARRARYEEEMNPATREAARRFLGITVEEYEFCVGRYLRARLALERLRRCIGDLADATGDENIVELIPGDQNEEGWEGLADVICNWIARNTNPRPRGD
jgi:hypothetical protein